MAVIMVGVFIVIVLGLALTFGRRRSFFWTILGAMTVVLTSIGLSQGYSWAQAGVAPEFLLSISPTVSGPMFLVSIVLALSYSVMGILLHAISGYLALSTRTLHVMTVGLALVITVSFIVSSS